MIVKAFCLLDIKTGIFNTPFFMAHTGQAIRACIDLGQDMNTTVARHPADFMLCEIGVFDDQSGLVDPRPPLQLGTVASFLPHQVPEPPLFRNLEAYDDRNGTDRMRRDFESSPELARQVEHSDPPSLTAHYQNGGR